MSQTWWRWFWNVTWTAEQKRFSKETLGKVKNRSQVNLGEEGGQELYPKNSVGIIVLSFKI